MNVVDLTEAPPVPSDPRLRSTVVDLTFENDLTIVTPPPAKRQRTLPNVPSPAREERSQAFVTTPSSSFQERLQEAASSNSIRLIKTFTKSPIEREYIMLGSTANVYTVKIGKERHFFVS